MQKRAKYDPGPVVSRYAGVLCEEIAGQWCMREAEQQAAANLAPGLQAEVLRRCPTHGLLQHYGELFDVPEDELTRRYEPLVTRRRWKALTEDHGGPKILPRHFTTQYFGWQCMAIASSGDDRGIYFATTDEIWMMDNEYDENSWRKIADIPQHVYGKGLSLGLSGMTVHCDVSEHALYLTTTAAEPQLLRYDLASPAGNDERWGWWTLISFSYYGGDGQGTMASKITFHEEERVMFVSLVETENSRPKRLCVKVVELPLVRERIYTRSTSVTCAEMYWFHSRTWIVTRGLGGDFKVIHIPYYLSHRYSVSMFLDAFTVSPLEGRFTVETLDGSPTDQFVVTDDGKLIVNAANAVHIVVFQLDPVARTARHIKNIPGISSMEYHWFGMAYSADPKQTLILLANGMGGSLTLFDTATLDYVGSFYCDVHRSPGEREESTAYVHRKRTLQWRKGEGFDASIHGGPPRKDAGCGDIELNLLRLTYGNYARVLFDRNRLILYGRNHYYMYTLTLGPPDHKKKK